MGQESVNSEDSLTGETTQGQAGLGPSFPGMPSPAVHSGERAGVAGLARRTRLEKHLLKLECLSAIFIKLFQS